MVKEMCGLQEDFIAAVEEKDWDTAKDLKKEIDAFMEKDDKGEAKGPLAKDYEKYNEKNDDGTEYKEEGAAEFHQGVAIANANCDCRFDLSYSNALKEYNKHEQEEKK